MLFLFIVFLLSSFNTNRCSTALRTCALPPVTKTLCISSSFYECCFWIWLFTSISALRSHQQTFGSMETRPCTYFTIDSIKQTFMTYRQKAMKNTRSSKWKNNNSKEKNDMVKYGFVIIPLKIVGYNDPEALGTLKKARKTDLCLTVYEACLWLWKYPWLLGRAFDCRFSRYLNSPL